MMNIYKKKKIITNKKSYLKKQNQMKTLFIKIKQLNSLILLNFIYIFLKLKNFEVILAMQ